MNEYNYLLIEDSADDRDAFKTTINTLNLQNNEKHYSCEIAETYAEGLKKLSSNSIYHGVIIDIKLDGKHSGHEIVKKTIECYRVPVVIYTGTPDKAESGNDLIKVYTKAEKTYKDIIEELDETWGTGLFRVLGGNGIIEKLMNRIFWNNLYPQIDVWKGKKTNVDTEKVLLRYAASHIQELIDSDVPTYETEEMYIYPPLSEEIKTGSIYKSKQNGNYYIILSPPCDLALHEGKFKTERILLCEIDDLLDESDKIIGETSEKKAANAIRGLCANNHSTNFHILPGNSLFKGGIINFRKVYTLSPKQFDDEFGLPEVKVQNEFVKNILNRFSAYYSRQGQPDFDFEQVAQTICKQVFADRAKQNNK